jgi:hypothetical protein
MTIPPTRTVAPKVSPLLASIGSRAGLFTRMSPTHQTNTQAQSGPIIATLNCQTLSETSHRDNDHSKLPQAGDRCRDDKVTGMRYLSPPHRPTKAASFLPSTSHRGRCTPCSCTNARSSTITVPRKHQASRQWQGHPSAGRHPERVAFCWLSQRQ